jgi:putative DNA methylase
MIFKGADATGFEPDARLTAMWLWPLSAGANGEPAKTTNDGEETPDEKPAARLPR